MRPRLTRQSKAFTIDGSTVRIGRGPGGVVQVRCGDDLDLARALGFAHACDRGLQMMLVRAAGRGRLCEVLRDDDDAFAMDVFMRHMGFSRSAEAQQAALSPAAAAFARAYCAGVNTFVERHGAVWELRLLGYLAEPWTPADVLLTILLISYVGLAQTQEDLERFILLALRAGVDLGRLRALFRPHLDQVTPELVELSRGVRYCGPLLPDAVRFLPVLPAAGASNNWALAGHRSATGAALQCNDPHLECNRLPAVWYELLAETDLGCRIGITMPGVPGLCMGRTAHLSAGFTYGFMDMVDFFVEDCRGGRYRRDDAFLPFDVHTEIIHRKKAGPVEIVVHENELGVLEVDRTAPGEGRSIEDGHHLLHAWSGRSGGAEQSLQGLWDLLSARDVAAAQQALGPVSISGNWLIADVDGGIGYQQSGRLPVRAHSGLHPVPAWDERWRWRGVHPPTELASSRDPESGVLVTANGDHNQDGKPLSINAPMGPYRQERITQLLAAKERHDTADMMRLQQDLYSLQAERFLALFDDALPDEGAGRVLREWDRRYDEHSRGAHAFERVYHALLRELFGRGLCGLEAWDAILHETLLVDVFYWVFDRAILGGEPVWFEDEPRDDFVRRVVRAELEAIDQDGLREFGSTRTIWMEHLLFGGRLPRFLGFDHGPIAITGSRATVAQGGAFRAHGRATTFAPSYRYVADLGSDEVHTALAGGPSDRRFSRLYRNEVAAWLAGRHKTLRAGRTAMPR